MKYLSVEQLKSGALSEQDKDKMVSLSIRLPREIIEPISEIAKEEDRHMSYIIKNMLKESLDARSAKAASS